MRTGNFDEVARLHKHSYGILTLTKRFNFMSTLNFNDETWTSCYFLTLTNRPNFMEFGDFVGVKNFMCGINFNK